MLYNADMNIKSAVFVRGVTNTDNMIRDGLPQVAFIGRSNAGKSTLINTLVNNKKLARTSSTAGRTQEINFFLINESFYFVDLPGYGYARGSFEKRDTIADRINGYFFDSDISQYKVVLIVDAKVGMTESDKEMLEALASHGKDVVIVLNKIDKTKQGERQKSINEVKKIAGDYLVIPFSSVKKIGLETLQGVIMPPVFEDGNK